MKQNSHVTLYTSVDCESNVRSNCLSPLFNRNFDFVRSLQLPPFLDVKSVTQGIT